jgi:cation diffusion facilitator CzcD-associated flavoprotein CzcO
LIATGPFSEPSIPEPHGLSTFQGAAFHSSRWDHSVDFRGKRVAVIGTGASAAQFVPAIQPRVAGLQLYQRTPAWVVPRRDWNIQATWQRAYRELPPPQRAMRLIIYLYREAG